MVPEESGVSFDEDTGKALSPEGENPAAPAADDLAVIRTYKEDAASVVRGGASLTSIAAAEQNRKAGQRLSPAREPLPWKKILWIAGITLLLVGGAALSYVAYRATRPTETAQPFVAPSFFYTDEEREFPLNDKTIGRELLSSLNTARALVDLPLGSIEHFYFTKAAAAGTESLTAEEFLRSIDARAPQKLLRSLGENFMFGVHAFDGNQPFLVFTTNAYDLAFAGMLAWEENLAADLSPLFGPDAPGGAPEEGFRDVVYKNKDLRVLPRESKNKLQYSFVTPEMLIIATNEHTIAEILTRLSARRVE